MRSGNSLFGVYAWVIVVVAVVVAVVPLVVVIEVVVVIIVAAVVVIIADMTYNVIHCHSMSYMTDGPILRV